MGQKVNPVGFRLGVIKGWDSTWFGGNSFSEKLLEDEKTATDSKLKSSAKGDKSDDYASKIYEILQAGAPISQDTKIIVKVIVMVDENGKFDYKIQKASSDEGYNEALKSYLDTQRGVPYPIPPNGKGVRYSVDFKFEG